MNKTCSKCKKNKPLDKNHFYKHKKSKNGFRSQCISCSLSYKDKEGRNAQLKHRYNITVEEYDSILKEQDYKCAICKLSITDHHARLHVDHCHQTDKVRGLLCYNCNIALGRFKDNISNLENAITYLKRADNSDI